ncbi:hypothetical protein ACLOJK_018758, partial [Asimina triloba]
MIEKPQSRSLPRFKAKVTSWLSEDRVADSGFNLKPPLTAPCVPKEAPHRPALSSCVEFRGNTSSLMRYNSQIARYNSQIAPTPIMSRRTSSHTTLIDHLGKTRPAAGTAAGGATVAGRRHRDITRPATGSHNPQA